MSNNTKKAPQQPQSDAPDSGKQAAHEGHREPDRGDDVTYQPESGQPGDSRE